MSPVTLPSNLPGSDENRGEGLRQMMQESGAYSGQQVPTSGPGTALISRTRESSTLNPEQAKAALQELREFCLSQAEHGQEMDRLAKLLRESDYRSEMTQVLQEALASPNPNPHIGALWIRRVLTSKTWDRKYPEVIEDFCRRGELGRRAVLEFVELVGKKKRSKLVLKALHRHGKWLRTHERGWPLMARAMANAGCYREAIAWTREWQRPGADFQVLYSRALALRSLGKSRAARPVLEAGVSRAGPGLESAELRLWHCLELALARKTQEASQHFQELKPAGWDDDTVCLFYLVRGLIRVQTASKEEKAEAFESAYSRILDRFQGKRVYRKNWVLRREYRRCVWRMSRDAGRFAPALLAPWQSADSPKTAAVLLLVPGLQVLLPVYLYRLFSRRRVEPRLPGLG